MRIQQLYPIDPAEQLKSELSAGILVRNIKEDAPALTLSLGSGRVGLVTLLRGDGKNFNIERFSSLIQNKLNKIKAYTGKTVAHKLVSGTGTLEVSAHLNINYTAITDLNIIVKLKDGSSTLRTVTNSVPSGSDKWLDISLNHLIPFTKTETRNFVFEVSFSSAADATEISTNAYTVIKEYRNVNTDT